MNTRKSKGIWFDDTKSVRSEGFKQGYRLPAEQSMITAAAVNKTWETRKHCPTCTCKRVYKSGAERQKAYRERHKAKP